MAMKIARTTILLLLLTVALMTPGSSQAGAIGDGLEARWRGAWVILNPAVRSNCDSRHTNNRINGQLSQSKGRFSFPEGELAQVKKISVQRSRIDVFLNLDERQLSGRHDGPFTLYDRLDCRVELEIETPREMVKQKNADGIDQLLLVAMDRRTTYGEARASEMWNGRVCEDYPADYQETLFQHSVWQAETVNSGIESVLAQSFDTLVEGSAALQNDPDYLEGFGYGAELARESSPGGECQALMRAGLNVPAVKPPTDLRDNAAASRWRNGHRDGFLFIRSVNLQRQLPSCFVPVPQRQEVAGHGEAGVERHSSDRSQDSDGAPLASGSASR
jgi:hypothetical protein